MEEATELTVEHDPEGVLRPGGQPVHVEDQVGGLVKALVGEIEGVQDRGRSAVEGDVSEEQ